MTTSIRFTFPMVSWAVSCVIALALAAPLGDAFARAPKLRASGGEGLLLALEQAPVVVVGEVSRVKKIDLHGYSARVAVERVIEGEPETGAELEIAWEELAPSREPRFADGERVLVALTRLPGSSLWSKRFPAPGSRSRVMAVAAAGAAFLRRPTTAAIDLLEHFLKLGRSDRVGPTGVGYLTQLVAGAEIPLSLAAAARLDRVSSLDDQLGRTSAEALIRGLLRPDVTDRLADRLLRLIDSHRLESLLGPLEQLAGAEPISPPIVFEALGRLTGGLSPSVTQRLLRHDETYRAVAARLAGGPKARAQLTRLALDDDDPAVRAGAVARLVALYGPDATGQAVRSLSDADPSVRMAAARALATLGADAVAPLRSVVDNGSLEAARSAVAGLRSAGAEGRAALAQIATTHPNEGIRTLARIALGGALDPHHHQPDR